MEWGKHKMKGNIPSNFIALRFEKLRYSLECGESSVFYQNKLYITAYESPSLQTQIFMLDLGTCKILFNVTKFSKIVLFGPKSLQRKLVVRFLD